MPLLDPAARPIEWELDPEHFDDVWALRDRLPSDAGWFPSPETKAQQTSEEIETIARAKKDNYITVGESIDPHEWEENVSADSTVARTIRLAESTNASTILLHDAGDSTR